MAATKRFKVEADAYEGEIAEEVAMGETTEDGNTEDSCPLILKMEGGGKKGKVGSWFGWKMIRTKL